MVIGNLHCTPSRPYMSERMHDGTKENDPIRIDKLSEKLATAAFISRERGPGNTIMAQCSGSE